MQVALGLILGGALGNLYDRIGLRLRRGLPRVLRPAATTGRHSILPTPPFQPESRLLAFEIIRNEAHRPVLKTEGFAWIIFLAQRLQNVTRSQIQLLNRSGSIRIEGRQDKSGYRIRGGETIEVDLHSLQPAPAEA